MSDPASRRDFLKSSVGLAASGTAAQLPPGSAKAQGAGAAQPDAELARLQGQRRILLKGGVVLTLDRLVGDFAQADLLIEDGKISAVRPNIAASEEVAAVIDAANHILIPGFVDTHSHSYQGILRGILTNGVLRQRFSPPTSMQAC
jgi:5-methylthioadenosine/S-adenosylhomocysteine deaminase